MQRQTFLDDRRRSNVLSALNGEPAQVNGALKVMLVAGRLTIYSATYPLVVGGPSSTPSA